MTHSGACKLATCSKGLPLSGGINTDNARVFDRGRLARYCRHQNDGGSYHWPFNNRLNAVRGIDTLDAELPSLWGASAAPPSSTAKKGCIAVFFASLILSDEKRDIRKRTQEFSHVDGSPPSLMILLL